MTDEQRVAALCSNGHDAHLLRDGRIVLRLNGHVWRVVGGDFVRPSLMRIDPPALELFEPVGLRGALERELGGPVEFNETSWGTKGGR